MPKYLASGCFLTHFICSLWEHQREHKRHYYCHISLKQLQFFLGEMSNVRKRETLFESSSMPTWKATKLTLTGLASFSCYFNPANIVFALWVMLVQDVSLQFYVYSLFLGIFFSPLHSQYDVLFPYIYVYCEPFRGSQKQYINKQNQWSPFTFLSSQQSWESKFERA